MSNLQIRLLQLLLGSMTLLASCFSRATISKDQKQSSLMTPTLTFSSSLPDLETTLETPHFPANPIALVTSKAVKVPTLIYDPGCRRPTEDYTRVQGNGYVINMRTFLMLEYAYSIYGGSIDIRAPAITQGHYTSTDPLSFGTHAGGGVVDISVINHDTWEVLYGELDPLINALRIAGFAAWLRDFDELSPGSPIHIHAVAIGDQELSQAAKDQLTGKYGYFRGYNGLPTEDGFPIRDSHAGPLMCAWMVIDGYSDMSTGQ